MFKFPSFFAKKKYSKSFVSAPHINYGYSGGNYVNAESAKQVSAFYRGLTYISTQLAKLPWEVKDKKNVLVYNNIYELLNVAPNDEMSSFVFKVNIIQQAIQYGNGYAEIERDMLGRPKNLWLIPSSDVELYRAPDRSLWYRIIGGDINIGGGDVYLAPRDIFHIKNFSTKDGLLGDGLIGYAVNTLGISLGADRFAGNLYTNGGMPSGIITTPGSMDDATFDRLKTSWAAAHSGRKTGGTAILEEGYKYEAISFAPDVLQFLESRKFNVLEIARFLGLPPSKLFDGNSLTYNNIEHANLEVATDTLHAWAINLANESDIKLLDKQRGGLWSELDLYEVFRGDMTTRAGYFTKMMQNGAITPNEIRTKEGLAPYDGGDRYFIATNNYTPADRIDEVLDAQIKSQTTKTEKASEDKGTQTEPDPSETELNNVATEFLRRRIKQ